MKKIFFTLLLLTVSLCNITADDNTDKSSRFNINKDEVVDEEDVNSLKEKILSEKSSKYNVQELAMMINYEKKDCTLGEYTYVDLGLPSGTLWATTNVGAKTPDEYGLYFAWGETEDGTSYSWSNYQLCEGTSSTITKYCSDAKLGTVDNKTELELTDDAARVNCKSVWRMPTNEESAELRNTTNCTWTTTTQNGTKGYLVTSKINGNSIFLPFGGYYSNATPSQVGSTGYYWTSTLNTSTPTTAYCMVIDNSNFTHCNIRSWGRSVRPVVRGR